MRARFLTVARIEYLSAVIYYSKEGAGLGLRFTAAIEAAIERVLAFPLSGASHVSNTRRVFVHDFPFSVIYRPESEGEGIVIFAIAHHARKPDYWHDRA